MQQAAPQAMTPGLTGQPGFGPQPFAQPQPYMLQQPYGGQPMGAPAQMPFGMPQAAPMGGQPGQMYYGAPAQQQAAPVAPVNAPTYAPAGNMMPGGQQQQPQNPYSRPVIAIARTLEQAIPGYQILVSVSHDFAASPRGETAGATAPAILEIMRELTLQHYAALGAIRRILVGETTNDSFMALAVPMHQLTRLHGQLRPHVERLAMGATPEMRPHLTGISQAIAGNDTLLSQASQSIQQLFGPQLWESAQSRAYGTQAGI